jgi:two-component system, NarL family, sensor kinase
MSLGDNIGLAIICVTLLVLLLLAIVVIVFFISARQKTRQEMTLARAQLEFEKEVRQVETEVSEQVRGQFAQELHDNIGQLITATRIHIENHKLDHPEQSDSLKAVEIYLDETSQHLRLLSRTLNHDYIGHVGLEAALQTEVSRMRALNRLQVHWTAPLHPVHLEKSQALMIFRMFQEICQNALRHARAKNLYVSLSTADQAFRLEVRDDGQGFLPEEVLRSARASGLRHILKRAQLAGFSCSIESALGQGTCFVIKKISPLS